MVSRALFRQWYTGAALGIDKIIQKKWMTQLGYSVPNALTLDRKDWLTMYPTSFLATPKAKLGLPFIVKSPRQGSFIGVSILRDTHLETFKKEIHRSFFYKRNYTYTLARVDGRRKRRVAYSAH